MTDSHLFQQLQWNDDPLCTALVVDRESDPYKQWVKETIEIRKQGTTMNRDKEQYQLSQVFDNYLKKSSGKFLAMQQSTRGSSFHH